MNWLDNLQMGDKVVVDRGYEVAAILGTVMSVDDSYIIVDVDNDQVWFFRRIGLASDEAHIKAKDCQWRLCQAPQVHRSDDTICKDILSILSRWSLDSLTMTQLHQIAQWIAEARKENKCF